MTTINSTPNITSETSLAIKRQVRRSSIMTAITPGTQFGLVGIFLYDSTHKYRYWLAVSGVDETADRSIIDVTKDPLFRENLQFHKAGLCTVIAAPHIPYGSLMKTVTEEHDLNGEQSYYLTCPIFVKGHLIGYVGSVINKNIDTYPCLTPNLQALKLLAIDVQTKIEKFI